MIKPSDILRQIVRRIPNETGRFCNTIAHTNLRIESGFLKFNASVDSEYIVVGELKMLNPCTTNKVGAMTQVNTSSKHKFTGGQNVLVETDTGEFKLHRVVNDTSIEVVGDATNSSVVKERLINSAGLMKVDSNSGGQVQSKIIGEFSYDCMCEGVVYNSRLNVSIVPTTKRMVDHYSSQAKATDKLWMYLVFGDRRTLSKPEADAGQISVAQGMSHENLKVATEFDIYVWWPTNTKNENARKQLDDAHDEIYDALNRCLFGQISDNTGIGDYHCVPRFGGVAEAETLSNFVYQYGFLVIETISYVEDGQRQRVDYFDEPVANLDFELLIQSGDETPQPLSLDIDNFRS